MITKILISRDAKANLNSLYFYKQNYSKITAKKFYNDFNSVIQFLSLFPYMYPKLSKNTIYRKAIFNRKYIILYTVDNETVYIDSIFNAKQNYINFLL